MCLAVLFQLSKRKKSLWCVCLIKNNQNPVENKYMYIQFMGRESFSATIQLENVRKF